MAGGAAPGLPFGLQWILTGGKVSNFRRGIQDSDSDCQNSQFVVYTSVRHSATRSSIILTSVGTQRTQTGNGVSCAARTATIVKCTDPFIDLDACPYSYTHNCRLRCVSSLTLLLGVSDVGHKALCPTSRQQNPGIL